MQGNSYSQGKLLCLVCLCFFSLSKMKPNFRTMSWLSHEVLTYHYQLVVASKQALHLTAQAIKWVILVNLVHLEYILYTVN